VGCAKPPPPDISIHEAAWKGNIEAVKQHLAAGTNVDVKGRYSSTYNTGDWADTVAIKVADRTPLHEAASWGHMEIAELLIDNGADVNVKSGFGHTPLHWAAGNWAASEEVNDEGRQVAELLIAKGADVNAKTDNGRTPLDFAIQFKKPETADLLRKHGGKTGEWLKAGESIHIAARVGHIEAVKQHLAEGVDVNAKDKDSKTPLLHAAVDGHKDVVELLIAKGADVNAKNKYGGTPLFYAVADGYKDVVELLIAGGADVNAKIEDGRTPLDNAIKCKHPKTADLLRKHGGKTGAELSIHDAAGAAGRKGNMEAVKQHLAAGKDVDARDKQDKTPLQHAAYWGHKEIAELLIAKGADINAKDNAGTTTLVWAVLGGKKESVELLIVNGVDVNAKSNYGTPLDVAIHRKKTEAADLLRKHGGKTGEELKAAAN
jgi:cytohesin